MYNEGKTTSWYKMNNNLQYKSWQQQHSLFTASCLSQNSFAPASLSLKQLK